MKSDDEELAMLANSRMIYLFTAPEGGEATEWQAKPKTQKSLSSVAGLLTGEPWKPKGVVVILRLCRV